MKRFGVVIAAVVVILLGLYTGFTYVAMLMGVGAGAYFFVLGQGANVEGPARFDRSSRIGAMLFTMGIAAAAMGHQPLFPEGFRVFYWFCLSIAGAAAIGFAAKVRP